MSDESMKLWANEGGSSVKSLVDALAVTYAERLQGSNVQPLASKAFDLMLPAKDWKGAATEEGWDYDPLAKLMHKGLKGYKDFESPDWKRLCTYENIEAQDREGVDYFIVSEWLAVRLIAEGEKVAKSFAGMNVWADTVEGPVLDHPLIIEIAETYAAKTEIAAAAESKFAITSRSYSYEVDSDRFLALLDSESHVTDNAAFEDGASTLLMILEKLPGVGGIEYDGHFGNFVYMTISENEDNEALKQQISEVIEEHLQWCATLPKADHVAQHRKAP